MASSVKCACVRICKVRKISIFSDGGSRGNPGPSASAFVVFADDKIIHKRSKYIGLATNNVAEYKAVVMALTWLVDQGIDADTVSYFLDSELVVKQLTGVYKVKNPVLKKMVLGAKTLERKLNAKVNYIAVRRERNKVADELVNFELDKKLLGGV